MTHLSMTISKKKYGWLKT